MPVLSVPRVLRDKLSDEGVEALVELLNQAEEKVRDVIVKFSEEKYERRLVEVASALRVSLEDKIAGVKSDLEGKIASVKSDLEEKIAGVKSDLEGKIASVKSDLEEKIASVKSDLEGKIANLEVKIANVKSDLEVKIANARADIIRWMFIFWVGQIGALLGILLAFFKK